MQESTPFPNRQMDHKINKEYPEISVSARNGTPCLAWESLGIFLSCHREGGEKVDQTQPASLIGSPFPRVAEKPVLWVKDKGTHPPAKAHKAIVDLNTGRVFCITSKHYRLIRHETAIEQVEDAISRKGDLGDYRAFTEFYNAGGRMRRTYRFIEIGVEIAKGDVVNPELILLNSYDTAWPFMVLLGAFRIVCTNGLVVGQKFLHLRKRHLYEVGQINVAEEVGTALMRFNQQARQWKGWMGKMITPKAYGKVLGAMKLGIKAKEEVESKVFKEAHGFDSDDFPIITVWRFYNILTWHITHNAASLNHQVELEGRLRRACLRLMR